MCMVCFRRKSEARECPDANPLRLKIHLPSNDDDGWRLSHDAGFLVRER
jgi:hypothetical protein